MRRREFGIHSATLHDPRRLSFENTKANIFCENAIDFFHVSNLKQASVGSMKKAKHFVLGFLAENEGFEPPVP
jgi:hypothetical protein